MGETQVEEKEPPAGKRGAEQPQKNKRARRESEEDRY